MKTDDSSVKTYACTNTTMISSPLIAAAMGTDTKAIPTPASEL